MVKDLTKGNIYLTISLFALPIFFGNILQQLYSIADTLIVGLFLGEDALAAVGSSFPMIYMLIAIIIGFTMGCSVIISQYYGAGKMNETKQVIFTSLVFLSVIAIIMSISGYFLTDYLLELVNTPANIIDMAGTYLRIYFLGLIFIFLYNTLASIFQALGDSRTPLYFLIFSTAMNILLDYIFVVYFKLGVAGVAWATVIAQAFAAVLCFIYSWKYVPMLRFSSAELVFSWKHLRQIIHYGVPASIQQMIFSLEIVFVQRIINNYGSTVIAGYTAANKITSIGFMPMFAISNAVATFTAQNIGAGRLDRVKKGFYGGISMAALTASLIMLLIYTRGKEFIGIFLDTTKSAAAIQIGFEYASIIGFFFILIGIQLVLEGFLRGAGDMRMVTIAALTAMLVHLGLAYLLTFSVGRTGVWWSEGISWGAGMLVALYAYARGNWKTKGVLTKKC